MLGTFPPRRSRGCKLRDSDNNDIFSTTLSKENMFPEGKGENLLFISCPGTEK
jgi:hypothetical protein